MTEFDPEKFEDKYVHYFEELEAAYSNAYQQLHGQYDSTVLKAIDRQILNESEPFYVGNEENDSADDSFDPGHGSSGQETREHDGPFRLELPDEPEDRVGSVADHDQFDTVLDDLVERIERELARQFELGTED